MSSTRDCMASGETTAAISSSRHPRSTHSLSVFIPIILASTPQSGQAIEVQGTSQTIYPQRARMTAGQERAWKRSWEQWGTDLADLPEGPLDTAEWFGRV